MSQSHSDCPPDEIFQVKVANAGNSCYLDSVLFAMFATPSSALDSLLTKRLPTADHAARHKQELQSCILKQFVARLRHCEHVTADMMNNIRIHCQPDAVFHFVFGPTYQSSRASDTGKIGWEYAGAADQQQDAAEFFSFLYSGLGGQLIRTMRKTFTGALPDNSDKGREENLSVLPIGLCDAQSNDTLELGTLLDTFFYENVAAGLRRKVAGQEQEVFALNTYSVENVPCLVAVSLKRFDDQLLKIESQVTFPSHINLHKYSSRPEWRSSPIMHSVPWNLRSIVCHRGASTESGHYYAYSRYSSNDNPNAMWIRLDDAGNPCITQANVWSDPYVKSEAVLFLFELDTDAHTAALMMLQEEEEEGMLDAFGGLVGSGAFGTGAFGTGAHGAFGTGAVYQPAIPSSLPASFVSSVLAGVGNASSSQRFDAGNRDKAPYAAPASDTNQTPVPHKDEGQASQACSADVSGGENIEDAAASASNQEHTEPRSEGPQDNNGQVASGEGGSSSQLGGQSAGSGAAEELERKEEVAAEIETKTVGGMCRGEQGSDEDGGGGALDNAQALAEAVVWAEGGKLQGAEREKESNGGNPGQRVPEFVIAPNGGLPCAPTLRERQEGDGGLEVWVCHVLFDGSRAALLCVSALPTLQWSALEGPGVVSVSVARTDDSKEDRGGVETQRTTIDAAHPTSIINLAEGHGAEENVARRFSVRLDVPRRDLK